MQTKNERKLLVKQRKVNKCNCCADKKRNRHCKEKKRKHRSHYCICKWCNRYPYKKLNIRDLVPYRDKVQVFGSDGSSLRPILTDDKGRLEVATNTSPNVLFAEEQFLNLNITDQITTIPEQNTATMTATSYAVLNRGDTPAIVRTEISPNAIDFNIDREDIVQPNTMQVIVPNRFLKFTRLAVTTEDVNNPTLVDIYYQAQTIGS